MKRLIFIHSHDPTTDFLERIIHSFTEKGYHDFDHIKIIDVDTNAIEARSIIAKAAHGSTIVFLGHGASHSTYLPLAADRPTGFFINRENFEILQGKNFICLACRSADFIKNNFDPQYGTAMLGFDDLPTDWLDIHAEREMGDQHAYSGITKDVLTHFRWMLVSIFSNALYDGIANNMNFNQFYFRLRLYTNRLIFETASYSHSDNPTSLAYVLYDLKIGIRLLGNGNVPLL